MFQLFYVARIFKFKSESKRTPLASGDMLTFKLGWSNLVLKLFSCASAEFSDVAVFLKKKVKVGNGQETAK